MREIRLYPEMNEKIVGILKFSQEPMVQYAAALIEKLQVQLAEYERELKTYQNTIVPELKTQLAESRRREGAAVKDLRDYAIRSCYVCKRWANGKMKPKTGEIIIQYNEKPKIKPICIKRVMGKKSMIYFKPKGMAP